MQENYLFPRPSEFRRNFKKRVNFSLSRAMRLAPIGKPSLAGQFCFLTRLPDVEVQYEFRLAPGLIDMPDSQELLNSLMGIPIPLAGGATVFFGGLTTIFGSNQAAQLDDFCSFVRHLKDLNCLVLLLSAEDIPQGSRLEYLVDTVINLRHEDIYSAERKPFRLFQLIKSRLQMSRPGSHVLHLSGERGLRFSPQLPSQLDSHEIHKTRLPDASGIIDTLRIDSKRSFDPRQLALLQFQVSDRRLINLYPRSKILIHGHGSSGKAVLALKILMARTVAAKSGEQVMMRIYKRTRILVISFLYPREYYEKHFRDLLPENSQSAKSDDRPELFVLALPPGFIRPEDFIARVMLEMDQGQLEGWPYTGVLLDGLHNTFLQFPSLQKNPMVWPTLYALLSRRELTIVSTFTTFEKTHPARSSHNQDDEEIILQGQLPFLHVLVQGTDFFLQVEPRDPKNHDRTYHVTVKSALGQHIPSEALVWSADECAFTGFEPISQKAVNLEMGLF